MPEKIIKTFKGKIKGVDEENYTVEAIISTEEVDRDGEIVSTKAIQDGIAKYLKHPVLLANHNYKLMSQIGITEKITPRVEQGYTEAKFKYFVGQGNQEADWGFTLAKNGVAAYSIGFLPKSWEYVSIDGREVRKITEIEVYEISQVVVPANPSALLKSTDSEDEIIKEVAAKGLEILNNNNKEKMAVSTRRYPKDMKLDKTMAWNKDNAIKTLREWASSDGTGEKNTIDWKKYELGFAFVDENDNENFRGYKLPHHYVIDGTLVLSRRGTISAMASLLGARGGVNIPDKDREAVYKHLSYDYKLLEMTPPPLKSIDMDSEVLEEVLVLKEIQEDMKKQIKDLSFKVSAVKNALELYPYGAEGNKADNEEKGQQEEKGLDELLAALNDLQQTIEKNLKKGE